MDKKEVAKKIYEKLKGGDIESILSTISSEVAGEKTEKMKFTRTTLLNSIGRNLGKYFLEEKKHPENLKKLWDNGGRDERLIVISAIGKISEKDYEIPLKFIQNILNDISDWEICDQMALKVVVNLAVKNQKEIFSLMENWIDSPNKWVRRLAIATIPPYIRARPEEARICLDFLEKTMKEKDRDVMKAIGWALREISKKDAESVFQFLKKWAVVKEKNIKWIISDGMKKLPGHQQKKLKSLMGG